MDKLAELLSGLNEVELRKAAELLQQLKGNNTAVDSTDSTNNSDAIIRESAEQEQKESNTEHEMLKEVDNVDHQKDGLQENEEKNTEVNEGEEDDDEDNIPLFQLHSLHQEYQKEEEQQEKQSTEEEENKCENKYDKPNNAEFNNYLRSTGSNGEETNTNISPCKQFLLQQEQQERSSRSAHRVNGRSSSSTHHSNKENELWLPARHSKRLQERAEKEAIMHHENGTSENDNTQNENETPRRKRSYKRKRSEHDNVNNINGNGTRTYQDGNNEENEEMESSSHSPSPQAHFIEMLMGCTSFRLEDDNYNDNDENRLDISTKMPGATQNNNNNDAEDKAVHTLSPQSPSPEAPHDEHLENIINNKFTTKNNKANKTGTSGGTGKRNKQSKEQSAAVSNTCSLTSFGFLPTPSHTLNNNNDGGFSHQNGFANAAVGGSNSTSKVDNNRLFTPFVPDHRIVPIALQFWNKKNVFSIDNNKTENSLEHVQHDNIISNISEEETNQQKEQGESKDENNNNTEMEEAEDNKQEDRTSLEMAAENADKYDEPSVFCLNDPDESSLMHPPVYINDGEVVIAKRTANNNNHKNEENEENEENNSTKNENEIDKKKKTKSVSWLKTEYDDDDDSSEKCKKDNKKFVKFASFNAMIEASNANKENDNFELQESENEQNETDKPAYVIHNNYMNGMELNREEEQEDNAAANSVRQIIRLLSHKCPCMFHTTIPKTATYNEFDNEVIFCGFYAIGYDPFQARPPYFGTYNNLQDGYLNEVELLQMARLSTSQRMPRLSNTDYEYDSGDDWDPIGKEVDLADDESEISEVADEYETCSDAASCTSVVELLTEREKEEYEWEEEQEYKHNWLPSAGHGEEKLHQHNHKHRRYKESEQNKKFIDDTPDETDEDSDCELQRKIMEARERRINRLRKKDKLIPAFSGPFVSLTADEHPLALFDAMQFVSSSPQGEKYKDEEEGGNSDSENEENNYQKLKLTEFFETMVKEEAYKLDAKLLLSHEERKEISNKQHHHQKRTQRKQHEQQQEISKEEQEELERKQSEKAKQREEKLAKKEEAKEAKRRLREERRAKEAARLAERALSKRQQAMNEEEINAMHACVKEYEYRVNTRIIIASLLAQELCKNVTNMEIARTVKRFYSISHGMLVRRDEPWAPYDERLFTHEKKHKKKKKDNTNTDNNDEKNKEFEEEEEEKRISGRKSDELTVEELFALSEKHHQLEEQQKEENLENEERDDNNNKESKLEITNDTQQGNEECNVHEDRVQNDKDNDDVNKKEELQKQEEHLQEERVINNVCESVSEHSVVQIEDTTDTSTDSENKNNTSTSKNDDMSDKDIKEIRYSQSTHKRPREEESDVTLQFITVHTSDSEPQTVIIEDNTQLSKEDNK